MIDIWFKNDLRDIYEQHTVAVFIDESGDAEFLLKTLGAEYTIQKANSELEELHVKYLVEKVQPSHERFLIYTRLKKDDLKFIREYCETCGCLEIRYLQNYIKDKVHQTLNLNINLPKEALSYIPRPLFPIKHDIVLVITVSTQIEIVKQSAAFFS